MNNMSTGSQATTRTQRARIVSTVLAAALLLAGCSSSDSYDSPSAAYDSAGSEADWSADMAEEAWAMEERGLGEDGSASANVSTNRDVIVTGELYMTVEDPVEVAQQATTIVQDTGGRIDARSQTAADEYQGGSAHLTLRIPASDLDAVVDDIGKLGDVDDYRTHSFDVTNEVTDLEARISTLQASTARIESLLADAQDISDIIKLETELADRQGTLEGLEARQRGLNDQVSMSTIELSLTTEPVVIVQEDPPNSFWDGLISGWNGLVSFLSGALVVIGVLLPWLALMALITIAIIGSVRLGSKRKASRPASTHPQPATSIAQTPPDAPDVVNTPATESPS